MWKKAVLKKDVRGISEKSENEISPRCLTNNII